MKAMKALRNIVGTAGLFSRVHTYFEHERRATLHKNQHHVTRWGGHTLRLREACWLGANDQGQSQRRRTRVSAPLFLAH